MSIIHARCYCFHCLGKPKQVLVIPSTWPDGVAYLSSNDVCWSWPEEIWIGRRANIDVEHERWYWFFFWMKSNRHRAVATWFPIVEVLANPFGIWLRNLVGNTPNFFLRKWNISIIKLCSVTVRRCHTYYLLTYWLHLEVNYYLWSTSNKI